MRHILGNKVLQYDVDDRGVIVDEREIDRDDIVKACRCLCGKF